MQAHKVTSLNLALPDGTVLCVPSIQVSAQAWLGDREISVQPVENCCSGLMLQQDYFFPHVTVGKNLKFGLRGGTHRSHNQRMQESFAQAGLSGMENRLPTTLSLWNHQGEHANEIVGRPKYAR